jgi:chromosome segregation ATPase
MDSLQGKIQALQAQNPTGELAEVERSISEYTRIVSSIGGYDGKQYDRLVDEHIQLTQQIGELKTEHAITLRDLDDLYSKHRDIQTAMIQSSQAKHDYDNLKQIESTLETNIQSIQATDIGMSSQFLMSMLSVAQAVNSTCKEISSALKPEQLEFLVEMIQNNIDVSAFLMREGTSLMDSEKEKSVISYIRSMMQNVDGEIPDNDRCSIQNCLYRNTYEAFQTYFNSYQSQSVDKLTRYDLEQLDHAYKNILTIKRLVTIDMPDNIRPIFSVKTILQNITQHQWGVDVDLLKEMIENAVKVEQRNQYIIQLADVRKSLESLADKIIDDSDGDAAEVLKSRIKTLEERRDQIQMDISGLSEQLNQNDQKRLLFSNIQHVDIQSLEKQRERLTATVKSLHDAEQDHNMIYMQYQSTVSQYQQVVSELDVLEKAFDQFVKTSAEIEQNLASDQQYKAIAEATSSTKGMPVITIRDTVDRAIYTTNQLLGVMYDTEIELLHPIIDENNFSLPFRCGMNRSADIRYGSQSESTLLSLALSLSLASSLTPYKIPLCDELDAYLDSSIRDGFILMLESMMEMLGMKQMFLISHNLQKGQFEHIVHTIDISEIISNQREE